MSNKDKRLFTGQKMRGFRSKIRAAEKKAGAALYEQAATLHSARRACADGEQFTRWLRDPVDGLGYNNPRRPLNLVKAYDICGGERDKILWERLGYDGGISKIAAIPLVSERKAVLKAVRQKLGSTGRGKLTGQDFRAFLTELAPSLKKARDSANESEIRARLDELEKQNALLIKEFKRVAQGVPVIKEIISDEIREITGIRRPRRSLLNR